MLIAMDQMDRYIARNVLAAIVVVQFVLLGLDITIAYIGDLGDTQGDYSALDVLLYLGMRLPWRFYQYAPVAVLIGALIGLGSMASSNELTVMRAAGRSLARIVWGVMKPVLLVVVVVLLVAEFVSPRTEQYAEAWRLEQRQGEGAMLTTRSGWQFEGDSVYRFGAIRADNVVLDLTRYRFDERRLIEATHANRAYWEEGAWLLEGVTTHAFSMTAPNRTTSQPPPGKRRSRPLSWSGYCAISKARHPASYGPTPISSKARTFRQTSRCSISGKRY